MHIIIISTDEDAGLRIESFAAINLRGVFHKQNYFMFYRHANVQRTYYMYLVIRMSFTAIFPSSRL
jgi:hypothetical protein